MNSPVYRCAFLVVFLGIGLLGTAAAQRPTLAEDIPLVDGAWSNDAEKFSFVILGDKTSGGEGKWPIYDRAVDAINLLAPDFVITVGDMIPGHMETRAAWDAEWAEYMDHAQRIKAPLFFTVGNHDIANLECYQFWKEDFGRTYYSFDYKGCHFLIFNTEEERIDGRGPAWQAMMDWTRKALAAAANARHTYIFFHKPMWDDPRFEDVWAELETLLAPRPFTVIAGHEHYHSTLRKNGNTYVVQSATGGGIDLSEVKEWGCFHSFGFVTVDGDSSTYAVVEPEGGIWPVDVAPTAFRKAVTHEIVQVDALPGVALDSEEVVVNNTFALSNVFDTPITIRVEVPALEDSGWEPGVAKGGPWLHHDGELYAEVPLLPGAASTLSMSFLVSQSKLSRPPGVNWSVQYQGEWLNKEVMPMVEVDTLPIFPVASYRAPKTIQLVGPFKLRNFDAGQLPENPGAASPDLVKRFGPEDGFASGAELESGLKWTAHPTRGFGLVNPNALLGTIDHATCYVACTIESPVDQLTHAIVGSDNFDQTYLNGMLIEEGQDLGGTPGRFVYPLLPLKAGKNQLVVKLINNRADWWLRLLVADPQGNLILSAEQAE